MYNHDVIKVKHAQFQNLFILLDEAFRRILQGFIWERLKYEVRTFCLTPFLEEGTWKHDRDKDIENCVIMKSVPAMELLLFCEKSSFLDNLFYISYDIQILMAAIAHLMTKWQFVKYYMPINKKRAILTTICLSLLWYKSSTEFP